MEYDMGWALIRITLNIRFGVCLEQKHAKRYRVGSNSDELAYSLYDVLGGKACNTIPGGRPFCHNCPFGNVAFIWSSYILVFSCFCKRIREYGRCRFNFDARESVTISTTMTNYKLRVTTSTKH